MSRPVAILVRRDGAPAPADPLAVRLAAAPGAYWPGDRPELRGVLYPGDAARYRSDVTPAGCSWSGGAPGLGDLVVNQSGVEITRVRVPNGRIRGNSNVTGVWVHDCYVHGGPTPGGTNENPYALVQSSFTGGTGWVVEDNTLIWDEDKRTVDSYGVHLRSGTARRNDIAGGVDGVVIYGDDCTVEANWIHDLEHYANDPRQVDGAHADGIQDEGGARHRIIGNDVVSPALGTSALILTQNVATYADLLVHRNRFRGGKTLTVIGAQKGKGGFVNFRYTDNVHGRESSEGQAGSGVAIFNQATYDAMVRTGNTFTDGSPMAVRTDGGS